MGIPVEKFDLEAPCPPELTVVSKPIEEVMGEIDFVRSLRIADEEGRYVQGWGAITFEFSKSNLIGTEILQANRGGRLRSTIRSIKQKAPDALPPIDTKEIASIRTKSLREIEKLPSRKAIHGRKGVSGITYGEIVPLQAVIEHISTQLTAANHPLSQAITQIEERFVKTAQMSLTDFRFLSQDLFFVTQKETISDLYDSILVKWKEKRLQLLTQEKRQAKMGKLAIKQAKG